MTFEEWWANWSPEPVKDEYERTLAKRAWEAATKAEREACAKVCENMANGHTTTKASALMARECMAAIRMRSNA